VRVGIARRSAFATWVPDTSGSIKSSKDDFRTDFVRELQTELAGRCDKRAMPRLDEVVLKHLAQVRFVLDDKHASHAAQRRWISCDQSSALTVTFASRSAFAVGARTYA